MRREREPFQRQVALASYGGRFLRKELALEDWRQHGIFFGARLQFMDGTGNALLADDFTQWLASLAQGGATRLSLHPAPAGPVLAVHYPDRYQLWAAGDVDCYQCVDEQPGKLEVPHTDWQMLAAAIAADLDIPVPSGSVPAAPFCAEARGNVQWAKMPLFVATGADSLAHRILATLDREQGRFDNEVNPKNESSQFQHLDDAAAAAFIHWGERLDSWIAEVQLRAANIDGGAAPPQQDGPLARLVPVAVPAMPARQQPAIETQQPAAGGKWTSRIALVVAIAALSLLILACANLIARFPWLSVLVALPWLLYMQQKKK